MHLRSVFIFLLFLNCFFCDIAYASFLQKFIYAEMQNPRNYLIAALIGFVIYQKRKFTSNIDGLNSQIIGIQTLKNEQASVSEEFIKKLKSEHKNQIKIIKNQHEKEKNKFKEDMDLIFLKTEEEFSKRVSDLEEYKNGLALQFKIFKNDLQIFKNDLQNNYQKRKEELSVQYDQAINEVKNSLQSYSSFFNKIARNKGIMDSPYIGLF